MRNIVMYKLKYFSMLICVDSLLLIINTTTPSPPHPQTPLEKSRIFFKKTRNIHKLSETSMSFAECIFAMWKETQSALIETKKLNTNANAKKLNIYGMSNIDNSNPYL